MRTIVGCLLLGSSILSWPAAAIAAAAPEAPNPAQPNPSAPSTAANNATDAGGSADEIIVTAQKRSESGQRVPISLMAFNSGALTQAGVTTPQDLQRIAPSFKYTSSIGNLAARFSIRGIGTFSNSAIEPSVASFIDGIYAPRPAAIVNSLLDIQSVEVLNGPQGTLFGRNASVGAVSYHTGAPTTDAFSGSVRGEYSTGDHWRGEAVLNMPLNDRIAIRAAGLVDLLGGYWHQLPTGRRFGNIDVYEGRLSLKAKFTDQLTWTARADYQQTRGDGVLNANYNPESLTPTTQARLISELGGAQITTNPFSRRTFYNISNYSAKANNFLATSDLSYVTSGDFTLRLLDGYNHWNAPQSDGDTGYLPIYVLGRSNHYESRNNSHELQFISPKNRYLDGRLDFVGGLYYFHERLGIDVASLNGSSFCTTLVPLASLAAVFASLPGATTADKIATCNSYVGPSSDGNFNQTTRSLAAYGQATFKLLPTVELTGGLRYTSDKKGATYVGTIFNPTGRLVAAAENTSLALKEHKVTYRANLAWRPSPDVMLFGTVSTGFKSGGFNNGVATAVLGQARIFKQETVTNYEIGLKSQLFDRAVTFNLTGFRMDIENFQERSIQNTTSTIRNVGSVRQTGVELDSVFKPANHVRLNAAATYLHSKITSYNNAPLPAYCPANLATATANCPVAVGGVQNLKGARLNYAPKWSGTVGVTFDGGFGGSGWHWTANADTSFVSKQATGTTIDGSPQLVQKGYSLLNARLTVYGPDDRYSIGVFGRNLADKGYCIAKLNQTLEGPLGLRFDRDGDGVNDGTATRCLVGTPRVIGVTAGLKF